MRQLIYLGLDAHVRHCVLAGIDVRGRQLFSQRFPTSEAALISRIVAVEARKKKLVLEESALAGWLAGTLRDYVDELVVCDPRRNALISRSAHKDDYADAYKLCRLLRLGELQSVYHGPPRPFQARGAPLAAEPAVQPEDAHQGPVPQGRRVAGRRSARLSCAAPRVLSGPIARGALSFDGEAPLCRAGRDASGPGGRAGRHAPAGQEVSGDQGIHEDAGRRSDQCARVRRLDPDAAPVRQKLWRYCKLGIVTRSSAGKPLAYKRLDPAGNGELKAVSYRTFLIALHSCGPNEVARFYEASLEHTNHNATRARLNTQRKILAVLWSIWKRNVAYNANLFNPKTPTAAAACEATCA